MCWYPLWFLHVMTGMKEFQAHWQCLDCNQGRDMNFGWHRFRQLWTSAVLIVCFGEGHKVPRIELETAFSSATHRLSGLVVVTVMWCKWRKMVLDCCTHLGAFVAPAWFRSEHNCPWKDWKDWVDMSRTTVLESFWPNFSHMTKVSMCTSIVRGLFGHCSPETEREIDTDASDAEKRAR